MIRQGAKALPNNILPCREQDCSKIDGRNLRKNTHLNYTQSTQKSQVKFKTESLFKRFIYIYFFFFVGLHRNYPKQFFLRYIFSLQITYLQPADFSFSAAPAQSSAAASMERLSALSQSPLPDKERCTTILLLSLTNIAPSGVVRSLNFLKKLSVFSFSSSMNFFD